MKTIKVDISNVFGFVSEKEVFAFQEKIDNK